MDWGSVQMKPPGFAETEVCLFGPGYGECVVLHVGGGDWVVIDSCLDKGTRLPIASVYLRALGLDPRQCVKLIVASHWHDDHVQGLADLVAECSDAHFALSIALKCEEFAKLLSCNGVTIGSQWSSGVDEMGGALRAAGDRRIFALENVVIPIGSVGRASFLSPTSSAVDLAHASLARLMPGASCVGRRAIPNPTDNDTSVIVHVCDSGCIALMGSDMVSSAHGWPAVVASFKLEKASVYKVAHHGSITGDHTPIWDKMLEGSPVAIMTPFRKGSVKLPGDEDVQRMRGKGGRGFSTTSLARKSSVRSGNVQRGLLDAGVRVFPLMGEMGMVRIRRAGSVESVDLAGAAVSLW